MSDPQNGAQAYAQAFAQNHTQAEPLAAVVKGVVAVLSGDEAVKALCGDPVRVWDVAPRSGAMPHLVIGGGRWRDGAAGFEVELSVTAVSRFDGQEEARAIAGAVSAALSGVVLSADGMTGRTEVRLVEVFAGGDRKHAYGVVRLRAVMES